MSSPIVETRTRILAATVRLLEKQSGRGVRMGDIAQETGISRQALYLHFASRAELLSATTKYRDDVLHLENRLAPSRTAKSGVERLALYIEFWGNYIPEIYGVAKALMLAQDTDAAAAAAWSDRMSAMRDGCRAAIDAIHADGRLASGWTKKRATDVLCTMLLVPNWEHLTIECDWSSQQYIRWMKTVAEKTFVSGK